jgi:hypothetical protein
VMIVALRTSFDRPIISLVRSSSFLQWPTQMWHDLGREHEGSL